MQFTENQNFQHTKDHPKLNSGHLLQEAVNERPHTNSVFVTFNFECFQLDTTSGMKLISLGINQ